VGERVVGEGEEEWRARLTAGALWTADFFEVSYPLFPIAGSKNGKSPRVRKQN